MSYNVVAEIKYKLRLSKIGTHIVYGRDTSSEISMYLFTLPAMEEPSPLLHPNPISIWN